jgi:CspA family cold shock protein
MKGTIARLMADKGFGFIRPLGERDRTKDMFFHSTGCLTPFGSLREGDLVEYDEGSNPKGPRAENVEKTL